MVDLLFAWLSPIWSLTALPDPPLDAEDDGAVRDGPRRSIQSATSPSAYRHSAPSKGLVTAFFQRAYSRSTSALFMLGVHSLSLPQFSRRSSTCAQNPTASPAAYAAPSDVVSATVGRTTGTPST